MRLGDLKTAAGLKSDRNDEDACEITGLALDSRRVQGGVLFAALPGNLTDGAKFIRDAVANGARAVLTSSDHVVDNDLDVAVVKADNPRHALAKMAGVFYAPQPANVMAVTGTSGKTSVADFTRQLLLHAGRKAASIGTIGLITADQTKYGALTTPDSITLHQTLQGLATEGVQHLVMEASSHGLDQHRLDGVAVQAGAFTNLGRDHLDYHHSMDDYFAAKMRLFADLITPGGTAVVNVDDDRAPRVLAIARQKGLRCLEVGRQGKDIQLLGVNRDGFSQRMTISHFGKRKDVALKLIGDYQVSNALVAAGLAEAAGMSSDEVVSGLQALKGVAGRLEIVGETKGALLVVDYAHKPEALEAALRGCRPYATGRVIVVFGCGGDRDRGKRKIMGEIAARDGDVVIVTDDNPRSENPASIRSEIVAGVPSALEIGDRRAAIQHAVDLAAPGDVVLVAGKGHETGQIVGDSVLPFSDHEVLREQIEAHSA